jgi:CubicO group peptidase (beta-lactamase class C family)
MSVPLLRPQNLAVRPRDDAWKRLVSDLEEEIVELMHEAHVPGVSVAIISDGTLAWRKGFGVKDIRSKRPVDEQTRFEAASTTKPVFAYAVMKLCERGAMGLDIPLTKYTPDRFLEGDARLDLITARHVLSHTAGFPNWRSKQAPLALSFTPGERWAYSGEGYSYLQAVVTQRAGSRTNTNDCGRFEAGIQVCATEPSIDDFMQRNLLRPFGMTSSGILWTPDMEANIAWGHDPKGQPLKTSRKPSGAAAARYGAAGGLCTTPTDYARFLMEIVAPKPPDAFRLNRASLSEMLRPQIRRNSQSSWALGWEINHTEDGDFIRHGGGNPGYSCFVAASIERKSGYVIMTNCEENGYLGVIAKLIAGDTLSRFIGGKLRDAPE